MISEVDGYHQAMGTDHHDSAEQPAHPTVPDGCSTYQPGDVIDLGVSALKNSHGNTIMTFHFEGVIAPQSVGERLGQAQAAAIRDVLTYLANTNAENHKQTLEQE